LIREGVSKQESQKTSLIPTINHPLSGGKVMIHRLLFICIVLLVACNNTNNKQLSAKTDVADSVYHPKYAKGFWVEYYNDYKLLKYKNPFDSIAPAQSVYIQTGLHGKPAITQADYYIFQDNQKWVALSSTHISSANLLNLKSLIVGVAEPQYISDTYINQQVKTGQIVDVGMAMAPNIEQIIKLNPAFVMVSPFPDISYRHIKDAGIAVIPNSSYMESTPLGRAEWLVFVAELFNEELAANRIFNDIEKRYHALTKLASVTIEQPTIFTGHLYQGIWNTSQGDNYMAHFFKDAQSSYLYQDVRGTGTMSLEFESVYHKASDADYWLIIVNHQGVFSYDALKSMDERYTDFKAFEQRHIICTNAHNSLFFEKAEQEPDVVLADLINAIHPGTIENHQPVYFQILK
jgi:iron complex transport system substrate-binding protein